MTHEITLFFQLSLMIVFVTIISIIMRLFRQPLILGYILTGIIVGAVFPFLPGHLLAGSSHNFEIFSSLGIALLLFIIGLGLQLSVFKKLGPVVVTTALTLLIVLGGIGLFISQSFGFHFNEAILTGLALFFSSTIIIVKILTDKKEQNRLHGRLAIGVILLDDLVATLALIWVGAGSQGFHPSTIGLLLIKGALLGGSLLIVSTTLLPRLIKRLARNQELLFLFTMAWGLGIASLFQLIGFSIEVGALFAGISLASSPYTQEMASRLKPLRDFFIVIFFITLGTNLNLTNILSGLIPALILTSIVILIKPLIAMIVLRLFGYTPRTSFKVGINLSQISEFSIILITVGVASGMVSSRLAAVITIVALLSIAVSAYLMQYDNKILTHLEKHFTFFQDREEHNEREADEKHALILFGYRRGGHEYVKTFQQMHQKYVVVDYDPLVIETLEHQHFPYMYGDATDIEFLREVGVKNAHLIVSTMTSFETNEQLVKYINRINPQAIFLCHADDYDEAALLYRHGASYVILPHYIGNERINNFLRKNGTTKSAFTQYRQRHLFKLGKIALANNKESR